MPGKTEPCALCLSPTRSHPMCGVMYCHTCWMKLTPEERADIEKRSREQAAANVKWFETMKARALAGEKQERRTILSESVTLIEERKKRVI